jgi:DNA-binding NarL/FixJ family response regulator
VKHDKGEDFRKIAMKRIGPIVTLIDLRRTYRNILIADDHPLFREALGSRTQQVSPSATLGFAATMDEVLVQAKAGPAPDIILLDLLLPGMDIPVSIPELRRLAPLASVIVVSMLDDEQTVALVMRSGADGFVHKALPRERCVNAISRILAGEYMIALESRRDDVSAMPVGSAGLTLTARQQIVLEMLAKNAPNKVIARELGISHLTVRLHVSALLRILGVAKRKEVAAKARALGLLDHLAESAAKADTD